MANDIKLRYHFEGESKEVVAHHGVRLNDLAQDADIPIAFGCSQGACGSCKVRICAGVVDGADRDEEKFLRTLGARPDERLACRVVLRGALEISIEE